MKSSSYLNYESLTTENLSEEEKARENKRGTQSEEYLPSGRVLVIISPPADV